MIKEGSGGKNTISGLVFEGKSDLFYLIAKQKNYKVIAKDKNIDYIYYKGSNIAQIFKKYGFYQFLSFNKIDWKEIISKKLIPDNSLFVFSNNTIYIIEIKFQQVSGSVDEKLQTCDFKKKQYQKLLKKLNINIEYIYLLSNFFKKPKYKDVLEYIESVGCKYYF